MMIMILKKTPQMKAATFGLVAALLTTGINSSSRTASAAEKDGSQVAVSVDTVIHRGNVRAEAHERYHHHMAGHNHWWDQLVTIGLMAASVFAICIPLIQHEFLASNSKWSKIIQVVGVLLVTASIIGSFLGFQAKYMDHAVQAKRWSSLRTDWEDLRASVGNLSKGELGGRAYHLSQIESRIESAEPPSPDNDVLKQSYKETFVAMKIVKDPDESS